MREKKVLEIAAGVVPAAEAWLSPSPEGGRGLIIRIALPCAECARDREVLFGGRGIRIPLFSTSKLRQRIGDALGRAKGGACKQCNEIKCQFYAVPPGVGDTVLWTEDVSVGEALHRVERLVAPLRHVSEVLGVTRPEALTEEAFSDVGLVLMRSGVEGNLSVLVHSQDQAVMLSARLDPLGSNAPRLIEYRREGEVIGTAFAVPVTSPHGTLSHAQNKLDACIKLVEHRRRHRGEDAPVDVVEALRLYDGPMI